MRFDHVKLPPDMARKMMLLKLGLTLAAPSDPAESAEVTRLAPSLEGTYGKGKILSGSKYSDQKCLDIEDITRIMANSTRPQRAAGCVERVACDFAADARRFCAFCRAVE